VQTPALLMVVAASLGQVTGGTGDVRSLIEAMESLQQPVEDFRCEFEGQVRYHDKVAETVKLGEGGLYRSFSGIFVWKRGGDVHSDAWMRRAADSQISRQTLSVRTQQDRAEEYSRLNDAAMGSVSIRKAGEVKLEQRECPGQIFLLDTIKRVVATHDARVVDEQVGDRPLKVLEIPVRGAPSSLLVRYWIDLRRGGHVVRTESYGQGGLVRGRGEIRLAPFRVGKSEVWMPVSGTSVGYVALVDRKPVVTKEPQVTQTIDIERGTIEFNKHPGPEVFSIKYKPGTPVTDSLRKIQYEYGQQTVAGNPTKSEVEAMLREQLVKAEEQKATLVVASTSDGFVWATWAAWGFGSLVVASLVLLWNERRRRWT
jgi:hypothetical protein